jgi:hypothetical protein
MIWLSIVGLVAGALLAQHFRIIVSLPATLVVIVVAISAGAARTDSAWSTVLMIGAAGVSVQAGYFAGLWIQNALRALLANRTFPFFANHVGAGIPRVAADWSKSNLELTSASPTRRLRSDVILNEPGKSLNR